MVEIPISDCSWSKVSHLFPQPRRSPGRPRRDAREVLNAILWIEQNQEPWHRLPGSFRCGQSCYVKYLEWRRTGIIDKAYLALGINTQNG